MTTYFEEVISGSPIGPRACSFWVEMPISAPKPNSPPSVKRVLALTMTAAESLLVHESVADRFLPRVSDALVEQGVELVGDTGARARVATMGEATDDDFGREFLALKMSVAVVPSIDAAIDHVNRFGSGHTEAILTRDLAAAERFTDAVDAGTVVVNASTRFTDGAEFGFGAEIGISTQKLHARGPMALRELTTYKYVVWGDGQIRD